LTREPGTIVGDYRLLASLGAGGSGEVYRAEHIITRRIEAVKLLAHAAPTQEEGRRFLREVQVQASLQHPNIAAVHNAFWTPHGLALAMELAEGKPLDAMLAGGRVPLAAGASWVLQTLAALSYAHDRGVVHRDVKPANIIVAPDGSVKLTDFGLARRVEGPQLTRSGALAGSPYYMAPEQVVGLSAPDARCDIYAVGVVLYEIAAGRKPFEGASAFDVMLQQRESAPEPPLHLNPGIGPELNRVILTAMAKDPAERYGSAAEFRAALERALGAAPVPALPGRRLRRGAAAAAALVFLAGGIAVYSRQQQPEAPPPEPPAPIEAPGQPADSPPAPEPTPEPPPPAADNAPPPNKPPPLPRAARPKMLQPLPAPETPEAPAPAPGESAPAAGYVPEPAAPLAPAPGRAAADAAPEPAPPDAAAEVPVKAPEAAPAKNKRHVVWRALGRVVRLGGKPAEEPEPPERPAPPE
jgi:eukaryotic-like serine/threonine-protein kinase